MFSCFGFASFYSPLTFLLRLIPFFYFLLRPLSSYSVYHFLSSPSSPVLSLHWLRNVFFFFLLSSKAAVGQKGKREKKKKKERVESCFRAMWERLELSGWVWGGCDAVRNHRRCGWRCRPLRPDWCTVSAFPPREPPTATLSRCVSPLTPLPPSLTYTHVYTVNTCAHMQRAPPACCWGDLLWVVVCSFAHYVRSATHE